MGWWRVVLTIEDIIEMGTRHNDANIASLKKLYLFKKRLCDKWS